MMRWKALALGAAFSVTYGVAHAAEPAKWVELQDIGEAAAVLARECPSRKDAMFAQALKDVAALRGEHSPAPLVSNEAYPFLERLGEELALTTKVGIALPDARDAAISGMIKGLGDKETSWITPKDYVDVHRPKPQYSTGMDLSKETDSSPVIILAALPGGPAEAAGIKAYDVLLAIDDTSVETLPLIDIVNRLKGDAQTQVRISVRRQGLAAPLALELTRATVTVPYIRVEQRGAISILGIRTFNAADFDAVPRALKAEVKKALKAGAAGIVLDLRDNSGGLLDAVMASADLFMDGGDLGTMAPAELCGGLGSPSVPMRARPGDIAKQLPLVVLVNGGTGSGAEIMAAALQHAGRAKIVGQPTSKRGVIQTVIPRADRFAIRLHTADLIMADGRPLNRNGVTPDIVTSPKTVDADPTLARAIDLLSGH